MPPEANLPAAVLFDMDGTLIDSEGLWLQAEINVMDRLGGSWSPTDQSACLGGPLERVADYMLERATVTCTVEDIMELILSEMESSFRVSDLAWRPGARELLLDARDRGVPTALVSASWNRLIDAVSDKIRDDLDRDAFDVVVAGDDVTNSKPHPEPYQRAAELLNVHTGDCLALEDSPTGVLSAVTAGCRVVAIPHLAEIDPAGSFVIDSLEGWTIDTLWAAHVAPAHD
jgi:HAD superfamily hydrolase (TIGR01509 family)